MLQHCLPTSYSSENETPKKQRRIPNLVFLIEDILLEQLIALLLGNNRGLFSAAFTVLAFVAICAILTILALIKGAAGRH